jgi:ankyrin repeat protein
MLASKQGDYNIVSYILNKSTQTINDKNNEGYTALLLAAKYGHSEICNILIQNNANTTFSINDNNVNMLAAKNGFNNVLDITSQYVDINLLNSNNESALILAAKNNKVYTVLHIINNLNGSTDYLTGYEKFDKMTAVFLYVKNI